MKIITLNVNGLRAAVRKGLLDWLTEQQADIVCMQEIRANTDQLDQKTLNFFAHNYFFSAKRKGYSGTAIYSKHQPKSIIKGLENDIADSEGRYLQLDFADFSVASLYLPSGSSKDSRQQIKFDFLDMYIKKLKSIINSDRNFIICGDFNIVHKEIDIKNFKTNQKSSGCLPQERAWLDKVFTEIGFIDAFRNIDKRAEQYTWWSNRGRARANNVGWRIDYQIVTPKLKNKILDVEIYKEKFFSDHAPLIIKYDIKNK